MQPWFHAGGAPEASRARGFAPTSGWQAGAIGQFLAVRCLEQDENPAIWDFRGTMPACAERTLALSRDVSALGGAGDADDVRGLRLPGLAAFDRVAARPAPWRRRGAHWGSGSTCPPSIGGPCRRTGRPRSAGPRGSARTPP